MKFRRIHVLLLVMGVSCLALAIWLRSRPNVPVPEVVSAKPLPRPREEFVTIGGVKRPASDVRRNPRESLEKSNKTVTEFDPGRTPKVPSDANPQVRSIMEARKTGKFPERRTPLISPKPFDPVAYKNNPSTYLNTVEPGRVWQPAQPGPGVTRIKSESPKLVEMEQGQTVVLRVRVTPGAPVTFTSLDMGSFTNQLNSITVAANQKGLAETSFLATPGTINQVSVLAASPLTSGQLTYNLFVTPPKAKTAQVN